MVNNYNSNTSVGQSFYEAAFTPRLGDIWRNTLSVDEVSYLAYYHALVAFIEDNPNSELARRELLYFYCLPFMSNKQSASLTKARGTLPTNNLYIRQILQASCQLYVNPPVRTISGSGGSLDDFYDMVNGSDINSTLNEAHKVAKFTSECLVRPYFEKVILSNGKESGQLLFEIIAPDAYYWLSDDLGNPVLDIHRYYFANDGKAYDCHWKWMSDGSVIVVDNNGNLIPSEMDQIQTIYNSIPYVHLQLNIGVNGESSSMWEMLRAQLDYNKYSLLGDNNVTLNGFATPVIINMGFTEGDTLGAGMVLAKNNIASNSGLLDPQIDYVDPPINFPEIDDYKNTSIKNALRSANMPNSLIDRSANLQSGLAMQIDRQALDEQRISDESRMKAFDKELINKIAEVSNAQLNTNYGVLDVSIEYVETVYPSDATADYQLTRQKFVDGVLSPRQYLRLTTDLDATSDYLKTDEAALAYINKNKTASSGVIDSNTNSNEVNNV